MHLSSSGQRLLPWEWLVIAAVLAVNVAFRAPWMTGPLEHPDWRQTENAYAAYRMMQEPVPDLLRPKVPYRGAADVHINEFPLHAFCVALLYKLAGSESLLAARLFSLAAFAGAAWGLFRIVRRFAGSRPAWYAVLVYASVPLSVFFSRAHHYDFMIMMFAFWFLDAALSFFDTGRARHAALAIAWATIAFLMKAPYCFYLWLPLAVYALWGADRGAAIRRLAWMALMGIIPLGLTMLYNRYRIALDAPYPESIIYPMKFTPEFLRTFFFGTLETRLDPERWRVLLTRCLWVTFTPVGIAAALIAPFAPRSGDRRGHAALWSLVIALGFYALIIFPMVASPHDYYSIPLITAAAVLCGTTASWMACAGAGDRAWRCAGRVALLFALLLGLSCHGLRREHYFTFDWQRMRAGEAIGEYTEPQSLVVAATHGRSTGWSDPRMLYHARRRGWSILWSDLNAEKVSMFRDAGATHLCVLITPQAEPSFDPQPLFGEEPGGRVPLTHPRRGERIGMLAIFPLARGAE